MLLCTLINHPPKSPHPYQSMLKGGTNLNIYIFLVPSAPRGFTLNMVDGSPDTLSASWMVPEPTNGIITKFNINCTSSSLLQPLIFTINSGSVFSTTLRSLSAFTNYTCFITASTSVGEGPPSNSDTAMTDEDGKLRTHFICSRVSRIEKFHCFKFSI